jgi:hypothetical protein
MRNCLLATIFFVLIAVFSGCSTEPNLENVPEISFSTQIQPLLSAHCNFAGCHGDNPEGPGSFQNYNQVMGSIKAGNAHGSKLYQSITRRGFVEERMPPGGYQEVSSESAKLIYWWIEQGAKNN